MKINKVSVVVLSWNGLEHLKHCLPALREQRPPGVASEVLLLDNGSSDGTAEWVRQHHPEVKLVASRVNHGFCGGNNRLAKAADGDAIVLLNNDTRPRRDWLAALVDALAGAADDVAAVSGKIVDWSGKNLDFARGVLTFDGHAFQKDFGCPLDQVQVPPSGSELLFACGGNMIVRRDAFLATGGFDETYFAYLEDVDLGWRLWLEGWRILFAPEAVVHHRSMATSSLLGNGNRGFLFERNAFLTVYKNYEDELLRRLLPAILLTLTHRTQTLMVQNNPGGEQLTLDPYAGLIANTARPEDSAEVDEDTADDSGESEPAQKIATQKKSPPQPLPEHGLIQKWHDYGPREFARRAVRKAVRRILPNWILDPRVPHEARLIDDRTISQLRAVTQLLGHLDQAESRRRRVQERRKRGDEEIFARFPLQVVPTYPGDERLFQSEAFRVWLGDDLPIAFATLEEIMRT